MCAGICIGVDGEMFQWFLNRGLVCVVGCALFTAVQLVVSLLVSWVSRCSPPCKALEQLNGELISAKVDEVLQGLKGEPIDDLAIKKAAKDTKELVEKIPNLGSIPTRRKVDISYRGIKVTMNVRSYHQEFEYKIFAMIKDSRA
jgi:hypothetical protein